MSREYTIRGEDPEGRPVIVKIAVTPDHLIAIHRMTEGTMLITPRTVSRFVEALRLLQAIALQGVTWRQK